MSTLTKQLNLYGESSESWKQDHADAMAVYDLEDMIALGLSVLSRMNHRRARNFGVSIDDAIEAIGAYRSWYETSVRIADSISQVENCGYKAEKSEELREATEAVGAAICRSESTLEGLRRLKDGKGTSLKAVMDGLRNNSRRTTEGTADENTADVR